MAAVTVGDDIKKGRSLLLEKVGLFTVERVDDCERIVTVDPFSSHGISLESCTETCGEGVAHSFALGLATHGVLVVHDIEEDGQAALHVTFPEGVELVHGSEGHALEDRAAGHGTVTEIGDNDTFLPVDFLVKGCTHSYRTASADDGVVRIDTERSEEGVHRTTESLVETCGAGENLSHRSVKEETDAEFLGVVS